MVLPLLVLGATTIASFALPFLFQTKAETATIELNEKLDSGKFVLDKRSSSEKKSGLDLKEKLESLKPNDKTMFILAVIAAIIIGFLVFR